MNASDQDRAITPTLPGRIDQLFSQRSLGSVYLSTTLKLLHCLVMLGLRPKVDGWRKYATAFLRTEDSRFLLAMFKLKIGTKAENDDSHAKKKLWIMAQLGRFLADHPQLWATRLAWTRHGASIQPNKHLDLVWAEFDDQRRLAQIRTFFDADPRATPELGSQAYEEAFIQAYNTTCTLGRQRPYHLLKHVEKLLRNTANATHGMESAQRVLDSVFVRFEQSPPESKWQFPDFSPFPHPGGGAFGIVCRLQAPDYQEADLWFHINHALLDGNPVLEALQDLRQSWGETGQILAPPPARESKVFHLFAPAHNDSGRALAYAHQFLSFEHLLRERARLNQAYGHLLQGKITIFGMMLWGLSNQPNLHELKLTGIVDVPAGISTDEPRTLGFITHKPNAFITGGERELAFIAYQNQLNQAIASVKKRTDITHAVLKSQALMPIASYGQTLSMIPEAVHDVGGRVSLTIMARAAFCAPPGDDSKEAVIAIGNVKLPSVGGERVGLVCIKGIKQCLPATWEAVFQTITDWHL